MAGSVKCFLALGTGQSQDLDFGERRCLFGNRKMKKIKKSGNKYFVMRHGEAESNILNVVNGDNGRPNHLTDRGKKQVLASAKKLKTCDVDFIFASPLTRTKETAELTA